MSPSAKRNLFVATAALLLLAFVAATLMHETGRQRSASAAVQANPEALARAHAPAFGNPKAKVHIVEFVDPACETCAAFFPHVKKMMSMYPEQIRLSIRHVPFHPGADEVVRMLEAARVQGKYLETLETLYAGQAQWTRNHAVVPERAWQAIERVGLDLQQLRRDMASPALAERMARDMEDARALGVTKTPEFFVNGRALPTFGLAPLQELVSEELDRQYP